MIYSQYYRKLTPEERQVPTTQEDQEKNFAEEKNKAESESSVALDGTNIDTNQRSLEDTGEIPKISEEQISAAIAARIQELMDGNTVDQLRNIAKEYGLTVPPRIKEETLAGMIANHEGA
jgi:hypothetical protein